LLERTGGSLGGYFYLINNHSFRFFDYFGIRERQLLILKKNQNQRTAGFGYFKNLKDPSICMEGPAVVWASNLISLITTA